VKHLDLLRQRQISVCCGKIGRTLFFVQATVGLFMFFVGPF
jgi:hypothetical protein